MPAERPATPANDHTTRLAVRTEQTASPFGPGYRRLTIGIVLTIAGTAFEALAIGTVLPQTVDDLGNLALYGWIFSAFMLANLIGITIAGGEVDRQGPARPFLVGMGLFVGGLLLGGLAPSMPVLILSRAVQGLGSGVIASVAYVAVGRGYPEAAKPRMLALMSSAWVVPGLIGPSLGSLIADQAGWRWVFLGLIPIAGVATLLAAPALGAIAGAVPTGSPTGPDHRQILDALRLAAGATVLLAGLGFSQPFVGVGLVVVGAAVLWAPLRRLLPAGTLRAAPGQPAAIATMGLLNLGFFGFGSFVPLALTDVRDQGSFVVGLTVTAGTICWTAGSWTQAHFARRRSPRRLTSVGMALLAVGMTGATLALFEPVPVLVAPAAWGLAGLGIGIAYAALTLLILTLAPAGQEGRATAAMQLANALGVAIAAGVGGVLIAAFSTGDEAEATGLAIQDALMIGAILLGLVAASRLPNRVLVRGAAEMPEQALDPSGPAASPVEQRVGAVV